MKLQARSEYSRGELDAIESNPLDQLRDWLRDAEKAELSGGPATGDFNAMCLSTVNPSGQPSARFVLLRSLDSAGLSFFSNYLSRKGREIEVNPHAAVTFWWAELQRQVRVEGIIERLPAVESDDYFHSRPRDSQLASAASPQSQTVESRDQLEKLVNDLSVAHPTEVPRPEHWGGYRLVPHYFEFWQGRPARLHDRIVSTLTDGEWVSARLAP